MVDLVTVSMLACIDDASIVGISRLHLDIVRMLVLHVSRSKYLSIYKSVI